jgi:hypothetical protein
MKRIRRFLMVIGILASSFAGGAVSHWVLSSASRAEAAPQSRKQNEEAMRWSFAKPVFTRKLTVGEPKTKASGIMDGSGMKLYDSSGKARIRLESKSGTFALSDSGGKDRVKFGTIRGGQTGMALLDSSGRPRIQLDPKGLKIFNSSGKEVGCFGFQSDGSVGVSVADKNGKLKRIDLEKEAPPK